ncbi:hypothetical protein BS78_06G261000 [Paspalum vaginatum]|nr:hypothetical protein BS78_06G261000 [Paspalum vaginatum]
MHDVLQMNRLFQCKIKRTHSANKMNIQRNLKGQHIQGQNFLRISGALYTFLHSWRCHPKLILTEETLGLHQKDGQKVDIARGFTSRVNHILNNHLGAGVKILEFVTSDYNNFNTWRLNSWLKKAVTPGIEEVTLLLSKINKNKTEYNFPCSILLDGRGNSIRYLHLTCCAFHPMVGFDCLRSLTKLHLYKVCITGDELGYLLSSSLALEDLKLRCCREIICLKIPFLLKRLSYLRVSECDMLQVIESSAPNLSTVDLYGEPIQLIFGESSQVKNLKVEYPFEPNVVSYAISKLPFIVPHLETLALDSTCETVDTPMVAHKFLHLKHLNIYLCSDDEPGSHVYDYLSLVSFLDAAPALESFALMVDQDEMKQDTFVGDASAKVEVYGFCSAKSMFELTCHILENAASLESLRLDCIFDEAAGSNNVRCAASKLGKCKSIRRRMVLEAHKALNVIKRYIVGRVPSTVKLNVGEPCSRCHTIDVEPL